MRYITLPLLILVGLELPSMGYDLLPTPNPTSPESNVVESAATPSTMTQTGTVVGGGLLATALIVGGLWLNQKRKST